MNRINILLILLAGISFTITPFIVHAYQISPNFNSGTITVTAADEYNSLNPFDNNGVIEITAAGTLSNNEGVLNNSGTLKNNSIITGTGNYTQTAGQTINNGSMTQASIQIDGGTLSGTGTITGNVTIGSGAGVQLGDPLGTLTIDGNFYSSGNLLFEIGGAHTTDLYDALTIIDGSGSAIFTGGNIEFDFINGYTAKLGEHWDFLLADSIFGWDTLSFTLNGLGGGLDWGLMHIDDRERLLITAIPEPSTMLFLIAGLAGLAAFRKKLIQ